MKLEIFNKETGNTVDITKDDYFSNYGVVIGTDGSIKLVEYGEIVCCADDRIYGVRVAQEAE